MVDISVVICSYCNYIGSGNDAEDMWEDVLTHEETCSEKPEN